jgi:hypothetical protein
VSHIYVVFVCAKGYFVFFRLLLLARFQHVVLNSEPSIEQSSLFLLVSYQDRLFLSVQLCFKYFASYFEAS